MQGAPLRIREFISSIMVELSSEDSFRLNVLLANKPQAIRIDESKMIVYGLSEQGEAQVSLNPTGRDEPYLKRVRELLSGHVTGSPGGYPVFLKRWTRMGQMRDESLAQLLLLGEPEAVVAAVCSPGITDELARRAWWAMEDAENARRMLQRDAVVQGKMGKVLAEFLLEYLPFETETEKMAESVRLILQPGLLDDDSRQDLWRKASRKLAYQVGFLQALPDHLPVASVPHPLFERAKHLFGDLAASGSAPAELLLRTLGAPGQAFLQTVRGVLKKPPTQDVVIATLDAVHGYYAALRPEGQPDATLDQLLVDAESWIVDGAPPPLCSVLAEHRDFAEILQAMRLLSGLGYGVVRPVFRDSTAMGTLMRRKLEPVVKPVDVRLSVLTGQA